MYASGIIKQLFIYINFIAKHSGGFFFLTWGNVSLFTECMSGTLQSFSYMATGLLLEWVIRCRYELSVEVAPNLQHPAAIMKLELCWRLYCLQPFAALCLMRETVDWDQQQPLLTPAQWLLELHFSQHLEDRQQLNNRIYSQCRITARHWLYCIVEVDWFL